jgi:NAD(P)-dependent dehydrogenase (short-subunit alcohol dehydrogenase family)
MRVQGRVALVTGAGRGIGRALCREFKRRGAAAIVVADLDGALAEATAAELDGLGLQCDVSDAAAVEAMVRVAEARHGRVDLLVSNAGFGAQALDLDDALSAPDATWQRMWDVHVMAHARACRALLPGMLARNSGCLVNVASAAGLLNQIGDTPYSATKHAAVGLAESLAITYGDRGIDVSVVCPQYVATAITGLDERTAAGTLPGVLTVEQAATAIADGIEDGRFLILTHPEVLGFFQRKAADYDRWLSGMRRLRDNLRSGGFLKVRER